MKRYLPVVILAAAALAAALAGCASAPVGAPSQAEPVRAPDWVLNPPQGDEQYTYFVGSGTSRTGSLGDAEQAARSEVLQEIMRYLGVRITAETTATARASLDSYQTDVIQSLTSRSSGRVAGLETADRWVSEREGGVTVYLLARYDSADLRREKGRLEQLFQEKVEAVSLPEREGKSLLEEGLPYRAAVKFAAAAAAAFKSDLENAEVKFERNMNQAREALRRIALVKTNDNLRVYVGYEFPQAFTARVVNGSSAADPGLAGVPLRVTYREMAGASGRLAVRTAAIKSDAGGVAAFRHPIAEFVGQGKVTMTLDMGDALEALQGVPERLRDQVQALEDVAASKSVTFTFQSASRAAEIATGVAVFDLDASGSPIALTETSSGLMEKLTAADFQVQNLPVAVTNIAGQPDAQVARFLARNFAGKVERAIYGSARIADHNQEGDFVIIQVTGTVKVVDLQTGKVLLSLDRVKRAQGRNAAAALSAAFKQLGQDLGEAIVNQLR